jgi:hypothetical protein
MWQTDSVCGILLIARGELLKIGINGLADHEKSAEIRNGQIFFVSFITRSAFERETGISVIPLSSFSVIF